MNHLTRIFPVALVLALACSESNTMRPDTDNKKTPNDAIPPQKITDPTLTYPVVGGDAVLSWTAPRDDDVRDRVDNYDIRYSYSFPLNWDIAVSVQDPPEPAVAGTAQGYSFTGPRRGRDLYAAIRSSDAAGNLAPISSIAHVYIDGFNLGGTCHDVLIGTLLEGLNVTITARRVDHLITDHQGQFAMANLPSGIANVMLESGTSGFSFHRYNRSLDIGSDVSLTIPMIEYQPAELPAFDNIFKLFVVAAGNTGPTFKKWRKFPVKCYIPAFINMHGLDYEALCVQAADQWMAKTGYQIFAFVSAPPDTGITVAFKTRAQMGIQNGITRYEDVSEGYPLKSDIDLLDEFPDPFRFYQTALHEFGHTIRLYHLPAGYLMYAGQPLPPDITNDEVKATQLYIALPNNLELGVYSTSSPR